MAPRRFVLAGALVVKTLQGLYLLIASKLRVLDGGFQDADRLVVDLERNRVGMSVLASMRQRKARGIEKRQGAPWTTSATIASDRTVRAPTPGVSSNSEKSIGPRSAAAASVP